MSQNSARSRSSGKTSLTHHNSGQFLEYFKKREIQPLNDWEDFLTNAKLEFQKIFELKSSNKYRREDFEFVKTLGKGAFGRVFLARMNETGKYYAIKVLDKSKIVKTKQVKNALNEKKILQSLNFPFCVYLEYAFLDNSYLYLGLPLVSGGEMFTLLRKMKRFSEELTLFYGAQVLLAFEYLHYCEMVFRDLKPENLLVDINGYIKLTDFGFCKVIKGRTYTLCGTPEYLAPEIILNRGYGQAVDWWTYGVLLFEMAAGYPPFHASEPMKIYEKAVACKYNMPKFFSSDLANLVDSILQVDLTRRYGNLRNGIRDIKEHDCFKDTHWLSLLNYKVEPPYSPNITGPADTSNFDKYKEIPLEIARKDVYAKEFKDF